MTEEEFSKFSVITDTMQYKDVIDTLMELAEREMALLDLEVCHTDKEMREITCYRIAALCAAVGKLKTLIGSNVT